MALITFLSDSFGAKNFSPEVAQLYVDGLDDISDDELRHAITAAIKTIKWMPKVVELRELAQDYRSKIETDWVGDIREMRNHCMWYYSEHFFDPTVYDSKEYKWLERQGMVGLAAVRSVPEVEFTPEDQRDCDALFYQLTGISIESIGVTA